MTDTTKQEGKPKVREGFISLLFRDDRSYLRGDEKFTTTSIRADAIDRIEDDGTESGCWVQLRSGHLHRCGNTSDEIFSLIEQAHTDLLKAQIQRLNADGSP